LVACTVPVPPLGCRYCTLVVGSAATLYGLALACRPLVVGVVAMLHPFGVGGWPCWPAVYLQYGTAHLLGATPYSRLAPCCQTPRRWQVPANLGETSASPAFPTAHGSSHRAWLPMYPSSHGDTHC